MARVDPNTEAAIWRVIDQHVHRYGLQATKTVWNKYFRRQRTKNKLLAERQLLANRESSTRKERRRIDQQILKLSGVK